MSSDLICNHRGYCVSWMLYWRCVCCFGCRPQGFTYSNFRPQFVIFSIYLSEYVANELRYDSDIYWHTLWWADVLRWTWQINALRQVSPPVAQLRMPLCLPVEGCYSVMSTEVQVTICFYLIHKLPHLPTQSFSLFIETHISHKYIYSIYNNLSPLLIYVKRFDIMMSTMVGLPPEVHYDS